MFAVVRPFHNVSKLKTLVFATKQYNHIAASAFSEPLNYCAGKRVKPSNQDGQIDLIEPATGKTLCSFNSSNEHDVNEAVSNCKAAFNIWSQLSGMERGKLLHKAAGLIKERFDEFVNAEVTDTGKPVWEARADIEGCMSTMEYFAGVAPTIMGTTLQCPQGSLNYTLREPLGVCGAIGAWNFPFQMAVWKSAPALACGNTMVFKPSPFTPLTTVLLADIYAQAGLPEGTFNVIQGGTDTGILLNTHPDVAKITFTGSVDTGKRIMENCSKTIKHVTLELGGKSPLIIFDDCDLENAVKGAMMANFLSQGQVCSNATRVYVHKNILQAFTDRVVKKTKAMKIGNPFDESTTVGATISKQQAEKVLGYIHGAKDQGADILCGGERVVLDGPLKDGYYISPCVVRCHSDNMTIIKEEVFGSVMSILPFDTEEEVTLRANDTKLGLAGGVFTKDIQRAHRVVKNLQAGSLYINNFNLYPPGIPFGGYKQSGIGRENAVETIQHFSQIKSVYIEMNDVECPF